MAPRKGLVRTPASAFSLLMLGPSVFPLSSNGQLVPYDAQAQAQALKPTILSGEYHGQERRALPIERHLSIRSDSNSTSTSHSAASRTSSSSSSATSTDATEAITHTRTPVAVIAGTLAGIIVLITIGLSLAIIRKKQTKRRRAMRMLRRRMQAEGTVDGGVDDEDEDGEGQIENREVYETDRRKGSYRGHRPRHSQPSSQKYASARSDSGRHHSSSNSSSASGSGAGTGSDKNIRPSSKAGLKSSNRRLEPAIVVKSLIREELTPPVPLLPTIVVTDERENSQKRSSLTTIPRHETHYDAQSVSSIGGTSSSGRTLNTTRSFNMKPESLSLSIDTSRLPTTTLSSLSSTGSNPPSPSLCPSPAASSRSHSPRNSTSSAQPSYSHAASLSPARPSSSQSDSRPRSPPRIPSPARVSRHSRSLSQTETAYPVYPTPIEPPPPAHSQHGMNLSYPPPPASQSRPDGKALLELQAQIAALKRENAQLRGDPISDVIDDELPSYHDAAMR